MGDCFAPDASCNEGHMQHEKCPHWIGNVQDNSEERESEDIERFPWSGRPMGLADTRFITGTSRPHLVGVAGPSDAGKTTLLAILFLALYRGQQIGGGIFAGSYTLQGWENIANYLQALPADAIQFPPHTSRKGRVPGLLHLAFDKCDVQEHVFLADASGEWFTAWTDQAEAETAAGARWIAEHADRILITADSKALSGPDRGVARNELEFLFNRINSSYGNVGVALLWTKTDLEIEKTIRDRIEEKFLACFSNAPIFEISVPDGKEKSEDTTLEKLEEIFSWAFKKRIVVVDQPIPATNFSDSFFAYRERP